MSDENPNVTDALTDIGDITALIDSEVPAPTTATVGNKEFEIDTSAGPTEGQQYEKKKIDLWNEAAEAKLIDKNAFKTIARSFLVMSDGVVPDDILIKMKNICDVLKAKEFTLNSNGYREKVNKNGNWVDEDDALLKTACAAMGDDNVKHFLVTKSQNKDVKAELNSPNAKAYGILFGTSKGDPMNWKPGFRANMARTWHLLLGKECDTPIKLLVCYDDLNTNDPTKVDFDKIKKADSAAGTNIFRKIPSLIIKKKLIDSEKCNLVIINLKDPEAGEKFKKFLEKY